MLSPNTFNIELKLNSSKFENLGEVMVIKPLKNEKLVLAGYEGGKLILWDIRQKSILSSLIIETCPMALDFDTTLMKGIIGGPSDKIQVKTKYETDKYKKHKKYVIQSTYIKSLFL
ncbi:hypothetical protein ANTRET_LOCUS661 [Anthophora retusa]